MATGDIEAIRNDLRDRVASPGSYDSPPPFLKHADANDADVSLWRSAEAAWLHHQDAEDRRFVERMDRKRGRLFLLVFAAVVGFMVFRYRHHF